MEIVQTVATEGRNFADGWVELIRQAGAPGLGTGIRDAWARFRDPANHALKDVNSLVQETYRETGRNIPFPTGLIREL